MKILNFSADNFQSYPHIDFNYADLGLALVSGSTGAGKSTLLDGPAWVLFGTTSKEGAADDVKAWDAEAPTEGRLEVQTPNGIIQVTRIRGKSGQNDLYFNAPGGGPSRGKDLTETQKLLEQKLGVSAELFFLGAYLHQFSKADSFFIAKAKERRDVLEKIADQEFAINLGVKASEARKETKKLRDDAEIAHSKLNGRYQALVEAEKVTRSSASRWDGMQATKIASTESLLQSWEDRQKAKIATLIMKTATHDQAVKNDCERIQTVIDGLLETISPDEEFKALIDDLNRGLEDYDRILGIQAEMIDQKALIKAEIKSLEFHKKSVLSSKDCPTCKRPKEGVDCDGIVAEIDAQLAASKNTLAKVEAECLAQLLLVNKMNEINSQVSQLTDARAANAANLKAIEFHEQQILKRKTETNPFDAQLEQTQSETNPHIDQLAAIKAEVNPFLAQLDEQKADLDSCLASVAEKSYALEALNEKVTALTWLYDKSFELRGVMMSKVVAQVEASTNRYLDRYFDASLRVKLTLAGSDKLDVEISNDGFTAPFRQLSGGERCMLKLAFSLSLMKAAQNKAGIQFHTVMLDEALNGLDDDLKVKAFGLLQELENTYSSVLVIDHSEALKQNFHRVFRVTKVGSRSTVDEQIN